jgi:hypothetical protein
MIGAIAFGAAAAFTGYQTLAALLHLNPKHAAMFIVLTMAFGLLARYQFKLAWCGTEYLRVAPQTSVTLAFVFSDNSAAPFESARFLCTVRNAEFAAAFVELNRQIEFRPGSPEAVADQHAANRHSWIWFVGIGAIGLYFLVKDLLR